MTNDLPKRKRVSPADEEQQSVALKLPDAPTVAETSPSNKAVVAESLRKGGITPAPSELLFAVGPVPLVVDTSALSTVAIALRNAEDPGSWFDENRAAVRAVVFAPSQPRVLRATPLLSVTPHADLDIEHDWPVKHHLSGLHLVVGGTGAGKSQWLAAQGFDVVVRWGEPAEMYDASPNAIGVADLAEALSVALSLSTAGFRVCIDSFRNMVFGIEGAAGQGGVSVALYAALTSVNNVCARLGIVLTAAINPMSTDDKAQLVYSNIAASVAGMTVIEGGKVVSQTARTTRGRIVSTESGGRESAGVEFVTPHITRVAEPPVVTTAPRLDTALVDTHDDESEPGRTGGKLYF